MNAMYQQVIQEKSTMKIDLSLAEKKATRKDERIMLLEKTLQKERETVREIWFKHIYSNKLTRASSNN
jgi:hypothetical protein